MIKQFGLLRLFVCERKLRMEAGRKRRIVAFWSIFACVEAATKLIVCTCNSTNIANNSANNWSGSYTSIFGLCLSERKNGHKNCVIVPGREESKLQETHPFRSATGVPNYSRTMFDASRNRNRCCILFETRCTRSKHFIRGSIHVKRERRAKIRGKRIFFKSRDSYLVTH